MADSAFMAEVRAEIEADPNLDVFRVEVVFSKHEPPESIRESIASMLRRNADMIESGATPIPDYTLNNGGT